MPTIRRGEHSSLPARHIRYAERLAHARALTSAIVDAGANIRASTTAADSLTLRGIPAIGRGVAGHVPGTQPEAAATR